LPALYATKAEALLENNEMIGEYQDQIKGGERDIDDEWDGLVLEAKWGFKSENIELFDGGHLINRENWGSLCGL
jgi:hypothetical protein